MFIELWLLPNVEADSKQNNACYLAEYDVFPFVAKSAVPNMQDLFTLDEIIIAGFL
jgi:hypothetical protein